MNKIKKELLNKMLQENLNHTDQDVLLALIRNQRESPHIYHFQKNLVKGLIGTQTLENELQRLQKKEFLKYEQEDGNDAEPLIRKVAPKKTFHVLLYGNQFPEGEPCEFLTLTEGMFRPELHSIRAKSRLMAMELLFRQQAFHKETGDPTLVMNCHIFIRTFSTIFKVDNTYISRLRKELDFVFESTKTEGKIYLTPKKLFMIPIEGSERGQNAEAKNYSSTENDRTAAVQ